jgi:hypothetical protein
MTGTWHSWQLILWGSCINPALSSPHPLPGTAEDPSSTNIVSPIPQPTVSPPHEDIEPSPTETTAPENGMWPWSFESKMLWIYGSITGIVFFISVVGVWYFIQRRKARLLQTHGAGREEYEFEVLPDEGEDGPRAGDLYDAFAGGEEYLRAEEGRKEVDDHDIEGFLDDSDDEHDDKGQHRLLKEDV